jgi:AcrR family transcriptional regulator
VYQPDFFYFFSRCSVVGKKGICSDSVIAAGGTNQGGFKAKVAWAKSQACCYIPALTTGEPNSPMRPTRLTRPQQQAQTREYLLTAAENVFSRLGYGGASLELIAAEAGFSKGAIYSNFPNKETLLLTLLDRYMERDMAGLAELAAQDPDRMFEGVTEWLMSMNSDSECPLLAVELQLHASRNPEFAEVYDARHKRQTEGVANLLDLYFKATGTKSPLPTTDLAVALTAMVHGISLQRRNTRDTDPVEAGRIVNQILTSLVFRQQEA